METVLPLNPAGLVGRTAAAAYEAILLFQVDVESITTCRYTSPRPLQQRITVTEFEQAIIDRALAARAASSVPFWNAIFSACIAEGRCSRALLEAALTHNGQGAITPHTRRDLQVTGLEAMIDGGTTNVALGSEVTTNRGETRHIHLLDFHCAISDQNTRMVHEVCRALLPTGFLIVDSGDSYHAASIELATPAERIATLARALLVSPIVDSIYIAHQLQQEASSIRISRGGKMGRIPLVIDGWQPG